MRHGRAPSPEDPDAPATCAYMEDISGNIVPPATRRAVSQDAKAWWQAKFNKGVRLTVLSGVDWYVRKEFRHDMEEAHPWLRYCADHWKADQVWRDKFSKWNPDLPPAQGGPQRDSQPRTLKRENSADEDQPGPSSKRPKTTAPIDPPRPKPTRKVGSPVIIYARLLNTFRTIHCTYIPGYMRVSIELTTVPQCIHQNQTSCSCCSGAAGTYIGSSYSVV